MEIWATGFNAWGQLNLGDLKESTTEPRDRKKFECLLRDTVLGVLWTGVSAIVVTTSEGLKTAGYPDKVTKLVAQDGALCQSLIVAGNEKVVLLNDTGLSEYSSLNEYISNKNPRTISLSNLTQITASQTTFTALTAEGHVYTWGDGRYEACLGREVTKSSPASTPHIIEDLLDLPTGPICKISSSGYVTAALTTGNDLYVWGGRPGQPKLLGELSGVPTPVDLEGEDIEDVAVGMDHMLVLTTSNRLFVIGEGSNGQLGVDVEKAETWIEVSLALKEHQRIRQLRAGYKNSFVVVDEKPYS